MTIVKHSVFGNFFIKLCIFFLRSYEASAVCTLVQAMTTAFGRWLSHSVIMDFLLREGHLPNAWRHSLCCGMLNTVLNLPAALLHWCYRRLKPVFDHSFFANLGFAACAQVPAAISWFMLFVLVMPYEHWDNMYSLMGFAVLLVIFVLGGMRRRAQRLDFAAIGPYPVLFAFAVVLSYPISIFSDLSFRYLFFHITCILCIAVTVSSVERPEQLTRLCGFAGLATVVTALIGMGQRIAGIEVNPSFVDVSINQGMPGRVFSVFENPNAFAEVLVMLIPLSMALVFGSRTWRGRMAALVATAFGTVALIMTYSRASWIGLVMSVLVFVVLWRPKLLPGLLFLGLCAIPLLPDTVFNRILTIFNPKDTSTASRVPLYEAALRLVAERPVSGAGLGGDAVRYAVKELSLYHGTAPFVHAHNTFLQIWLETGLLGIVSFFAAMVAGIKAVGHASKNPDCPVCVRLVTIGAASALAGTLLNGMADYLWNYPRVMLIFWFVFAILLAGVKLCRASNHAHDKEGL